MPTSPRSSGRHRGSTLPVFGWALAWLAGTAAVTGFSVTRHAPALEHLMLDEVQDAVLPLGDAPIVVSVRDHEATLSGSVGDAEHRDAMLAAAGDSLGIRRVVDRLVVREDAVAVDAPDPVEEPPAEELPVAELPDEELAIDEPLPLDAEAEAMVAEMPSGSLSGGGGEEADGGSGTRDTASAETSTGTTPPSLRLEVVDGVLTLEGALSDEDDTDALIDTATESFDLDYVTEALESDAGTARADWLEPLVALLPALRTLDEPGVEIDGRQVTLRGTAPDASARDRVVEAARERLGDYSLVERLEVAAPAPAESTAPVADADGPGTDEDVPDPTPAAVAADEASGDTTGTSSERLRAALGALSDAKILFESDSDTLTAESRTTLDAVARVLSRHADVPIAIEGHTDSLGYRDTNLRLSQQRANAVRDHLVERGIPRERLTAYGYGEGVPIADNTTPEGRAANRRIEFTY